MSSENNVILKFSNDGSGVLLCIQGQTPNCSKEITFSAFEYNLLQSLFKICDLNSMGSLDIGNLCFRDLLKRTKLKLAQLKLIKRVVTQITSLEIIPKNMQDDNLL